MEKILVIAILVTAIMVVTIGGISLLIGKAEKNAGSRTFDPWDNGALHLRTASKDKAEDAQRRRPDDGTNSSVSQAEALRSIEGIVYRGSAWTDTKDAVRGVLNRVEY